MRGCGHVRGHVRGHVHAPAAAYSHIHDFCAFVDAHGDGLVGFGPQQRLLQGFAAALGSFHRLLDQDFLQSHAEDAEVIPYRSQKLLGVNPEEQSGSLQPDGPLIAGSCCGALQGPRSDWLLLLLLVC